MRQSKKTKQKAPASTSNFLIYLTWISIITVVIGVIVGIYFLFNLFMPAYGTTLILLLCLYFIVKKITIMLLFPGSLSSNRTFLETSYSKINVDGIIESLSLIDQFLKWVQKEQGALPLLKTQLQMLRSINKTLTNTHMALWRLGQEKPKLLTELQADIALLLDLLLSSSKTVILKCQLKNISLRKILTDEILEDYDQEITIENVSELANFCTHCKKLKDILKLTQIPDRAFKKKYKNQHNTVLGSIHYCLEEFGTHFKIKKLKIIGVDKNEIHGIIVQCPPEKRRQETPTLIYCDGNAGLYEFSYLQDRWTSKMTLEFGFDVVFWNYRGYGSSTGSPSPKNLFADIEKLYDYLKENEKIQQIGVFGTSLGGLPATHLASVRKVQILYVDRSFSCISEIAYYTMFSLFRPLIRLITDFDVFSPEKYIKADCYKVAAYNPSDPVIGFMGSFPVGLAKLYAQTQIISKQKGYYSNGDYSMLKNFFGFWRRTSIFSGPGKIANDASQFYLPLQNQKALFQALTNIVDMIHEVLKRIKEGKIDNNDQELQSFSLARRRSRINFQDVDCSLQQDCMFNINNFIDYANKEQKSKLQEDFFVKKEFLESPFKQNSTTQKKEKIEKSDKSFEKVRKIKYNDILPTDQNLLNEIKQVAKKILTILDQYDAAGINLLSCLKSYNSYFNMFQIFIMNLFIWGSYPSLQETLFHYPSLSEYQKYAEVFKHKIVMNL